MLDSPPLCDDIDRRPTDSVNDQNNRQDSSIERIFFQIILLQSRMICACRSCQLQLEDIYQQNEA